MGKFAIAFVLLVSACNGTPLSSPEEEPMCTAYIDGATCAVAYYDWLIDATEHTSDGMTFVLVMGGNRVDRTDHADSGLSIYDATGAMIRSEGSTAQWNALDKNNVVVDVQARFAGREVDLHMDGVSFFNHGN